MRLPGRLDALRERNFRLFFLGQATSQLGTGMVPVALSWAVLELTGSVSDVGLVLAAHLLGLSGTLWLGAAVGTISTIVIVSLPSIRTLEAEPAVPIADQAARA